MYWAVLSSMCPRCFSFLFSHRWHVVIIIFHFFCCEHRYLFIKRMNTCNSDRAASIIHRLVSSDTSNFRLWCMAYRAARCVIDETMSWLLLQEMQLSRSRAHFDKVVHVSYERIAFQKAFPHTVCFTTENLFLLRFHVTVQKTLEVEGGGLKVVSCIWTFLNH